MQGCQFRVHRHVKGGQLVIGATQICQGGEELYAFQIDNLLTIDRHLLHGTNFQICDDAICAVTLGENIVAEIGIGEVCLIDGYKFEVNPFRRAVCSFAPPLHVPFLGLGGSHLRGGYLVAFGCLILINIQISRSVGFVRQTVDECFHTFTTDFIAVAL